MGSVARWSWLVPPLAGLAHAASMAWPGSGAPRWWLQWLALALLVAWVDRRLDTPGNGGSRPHLRGTVAGAWLFATAWLAGVFWWLFISMHTYGGLPPALAAAAVLALAAALGTYYALAIAVYGTLVRRRPDRAPLTRAVLFMAAWTLAELARARWLTGFPWGASGYAHVDGPLAAYAPWIGVHGIGAVAALMAALAPRLLRCGAWPRIALLVLMTVPTVAAQADAREFTQPTGRHSVALLQGNIPQDEKFVPGTGVAQALRWYGEQLGAARADLVVAPETALPVLPSQLPPGYWDALRAAFESTGRGVLIGVPLGDEASGYTNSAIGWTGEPAGALYRYDKHHLVPFGEFIPPLFRWFTERMNIPLGDFGRGALVQPPMRWRGERLAPNICYEDVFGEELGARFAQPGQEPTVFVNLTNIAWFGDSIAIDQHLHLSRMRALEFERPMLRATNTGATVVIDHRGVVTHALARHTRGVLRAEFEGRTGRTPYARWVAHAGLWPLWGLAALLLVLGAWPARRGARSAAP